jgi:transposase-like protein
MTKRFPFKYFKTSPEIIRLVVMLYVRFPLSSRNVEDLLHEPGIDVSHETVMNAVTTRYMTTNSTAPRHLPSGGCFVLHRFTACGQTETSSN